MAIIQVDHLEASLNPEVAILIFLFTLTPWLFYKFLLKEVSKDRHSLLQDWFSSLWRYASATCILYALYWTFKEADLNFVKFLQYEGLITIILGAVVLVKATRLLTLEYMFWDSMKAGVPLLPVNIVSLLLSLILVIWFANAIFGVQLAPLLATSAVFSIILGLALQDTLGNLFAGIALQFDKPYKIGDWIETYNGSQKIIGQVKEISWRATLLVGWTDEIVTIPNRTMAQTQISNFSEGPFIKSQTFRLNYDVNVETAKAVLKDVVNGIPEILKSPVPLYLVTEANESWMALKVIYYINQYGKQFVIGDKLFLEGVLKLKKAGIEPASQKLQIIKDL